MLFSTIGQELLFVWMMGAGFLIAALCALEAALRRLLEAGFWLTLMLDALTGLGVGLILIAALITGSYGRLRLFELLGAALGAALFATGVFPPARRLISALARGLRHILRIIAENRAIKVIFK